MLGQLGSGGPGGSDDSDARRQYYSKLDALNVPSVFIVLEEAHAYWEIHHVLGEAYPRRPPNSTYPDADHKGIKTI